jgi:hypothetical protein
VSHAKFAVFQTQKAAEDERDSLVEKKVFNLAQVQIINVNLLHLENSTLPEVSIGLMKNVWALWAVAP